MLFRETGAEWLVKMALHKTVNIVDVHQLSSVVRNQIDSIVVIDSRSFLEYNTCHVTGAVNVCCSKIVKRRLQQDKVTVRELLAHACQRDVDDKHDLVVYDQASVREDNIPADSFLSVLLKKLLPVFRSVNLVKGGFLEFQASYPNLCEDKTRKCSPLTSLSQPCLSVANQGPTRILPFLYLGSQHDALNKDLLKDHNITYELNVSNSLPKPDFMQDAHFLRIPVNDNYCDKLLPFFPKAFQFLDMVRESGCNVLVHCLAGISRSPTIAIAYVMRHLKMTSDDGYRYVKSKRVTISPNFNFLGQLLEYEKQLRRESVLEKIPEVTTAPALGHGQKRLCRADMRNLTLNLPSPVIDPKPGDQSPTTALAKLNFGSEEPSPEVPVSRDCPDWPTGLCLFRSSSCTQDWLSACKEDSTVEHGEQVVPLKERRFGLEGASFHKRDSLLEGVVPSQLDPLPQVEELDCEAEDLEKTSTGASASQQANEPCCVNPADQHMKLGCDWELQSSLSVTQMDLNSNYRRSDSTCTSGLGSESSDCPYSSESRTSADGERIFFRFSSQDDELTSLSSDATSKTNQCLLSEKYNAWEPIRSPLSPSERHFLEDVEDSGPDGNQEDSNNIAVVWNVEDTEKEISKEGKVTTTTTSNKVMPLMSLDRSRKRKQDVTDVSEAAAGKADGLYRAQSCPGILHWLQRTSSTTGAEWSATPPLRRGKSSEEDRARNNRNRYSCGSLEQPGQELQLRNYSYESCPDVLHFENEADKRNAKHLYRHSVDLIQVS